MGNCRHCGESAGFLRSVHRECRDNHEAGLREMASLAAQAASTSDFNEDALRRVLATIAEKAWVDADGISAAIAQGWRDAVGESLSDGILTQTEETRLRAFRDRLALEGNKLDDAALARLDDAARDRLMTSARQAALAASDAEARLQGLRESLAGSELSGAEQSGLLVAAWEAAVETALEDALLTREEEAALTRYMDHFNLQTTQVNANGAYRSLVEAVVLREVAEGIIPQRFSASDLPMNFQKSEQLVWAFDEVDYYETKTRRERRGSSHGVSIRVAKGLYYSPRQFRSQSYEWEETLHVDTGLLALTTKHIYFHGGRKRFRIRFDKIVSFDQMSDGFEVMRDAQTAKPQAFRTGDGWFVYNLAVNLARL